MFKGLTNLRYIIRPPRFYVYRTTWNTWNSRDICSLVSSPRRESFAQGYHPVIGTVFVCSHVARFNSISLLNVVLHLGRHHSLDKEEPPQGHGPLPSAPRDPQVGLDPKHVRLDLLGTRNPERRNVGLEYGKRINSRIIERLDFGGLVAIT